MVCSSPFGSTSAYEILFSSTFDRILDRDADEEHISLPCQGIVRILARFNKPLPVPVTCILYAEFP